jgi:hypothetical protein
MQEESIFIEALEKKDAAKRAAFLDQACAGDEALGQRIERLLLRHGQTDSLLDAPAAGVSATVDQPAADCPGVPIGPYKLVQPISEGGLLGLMSDWRVTFSGPPVPSWLAQERSLTGD